MSVLWLNGNCPKIPDITDERIAELLTKMQPVLRNAKGELHHIEPVDPRKIAFTWAPKFTKQVKAWADIGRIETNHSCGYIGLFKPSISEVLAQIPEHFLNSANCFETLSGDSVACYGQGDGHRTVTIFYKDLTEEPEMKDYPDDGPNNEEVRLATIRQSNCWTDERRLWQRNQQWQFKRPYLSDIWRDLPLGREPEWYMDTLYQQKPGT